MNESPSTSPRLFGLKYWQWLIAILPTIAAAITYPVAHAYYRPLLENQPDNFYGAGMRAFFDSQMALFVTALVPAVVFSYREKKWQLRILGIPVWWGAFVMGNGFVAMLGFGIIDGLTK